MKSQKRFGLLIHRKASLLMYRMKPVNRSFHVIETVEYFQLTPHDPIHQRPQ
jgi:hypothetical protein